MACMGAWLDSRKRERSVGWPVDVVCLRPVGRARMQRQGPLEVGAATGRRGISGAVPGAAGAFSAPASESVRWWRWNPDGKGSPWERMTNPEAWMPAGLDARARGKCPAPGHRAVFDHPPVQRLRGGKNIGGVDASLRLDTGEARKDMDTLDEWLASS